MLSFIAAAHALSHAMLVAGIIVLLFTPVARVVVSLLDFVLNRDWLFVALNSVVFFLLGSAFIAAFRCRERAQRRAALAAETSGNDSRM